MSQEVDRAKIKLWLSRRRLLGAALGVMAAGALLLLSAAVLAAYFVFFHSLLLMAFGRWEFFTEALGAGISFGLIALLFAASRLTSRRYLDELCVETDSVLGHEVMKRRPMRAYAMSALEPLPWSFAGKVAPAVLLGGPRLAAAAFRQLARALRLLRMDVRPCARVIALVYERGGRVPFEEIARALPDVNPVKVLPQLADVRGVMFHASDPPGVSIADGLRGEIEAAAGRGPT